MFSISFSLDKILVLLIIVGTIFSLQRMYETFIDNHQGRMSFPNHSLTSRDKHLNSLHLSHGWRNAYRIGGGSPLFRVMLEMRENHKHYKIYHVIILLKMIPLNITLFLNKD